MKDMLYAVIALVSAAAAVFSFLKYTDSDDNKLYLVVAILCGLVHFALNGVGCFVAAARSATARQQQYCAQP